MYKGGKANNLSIATASVRTNGKTEYFISVNGKNWKGNAPNSIPLDGKIYQVVRIDSQHVPPVQYGVGKNGNPITNYNHAEQGLFSHISQNYSGKKADINIAVQNTSKSNPGMCEGCSINSQKLANDNPNFNINIYKGSTAVNP